VHINLGLNIHKTCVRLACVRVWHGGKIAPLRLDYRPDEYLNGSAWPPMVAMVRTAARMAAGRSCPMTPVMAWAMAPADGTMAARPTRRRRCLFEQETCLFELYLSQLANFIRVTMASEELLDLSQGVARGCGLGYV
jgi:hypothetical protein